MQMPDHPLAPCSLGLSATSQQYFSLRTNQPPATSQQYFSLTTNQHQPSANRTGWCRSVGQVNSTPATLSETSTPGLLMFPRVTRCVHPCTRSDESFVCIIAFRIIMMKTRHVFSKPTSSWRAAVRRDGPGRKRKPIVSVHFLKKL
jgi:hypothetical protein